MSCKSNWCPGQLDFNCPTHSIFHAAAPAKYTGNYNIGNRPCLPGLKKCSFGCLSWCSHDGTCGLSQFKAPAIPYNIYGAVYMPKSLLYKKWKEVERKNDRKSNYGIDYKRLNNYKRRPKKTPECVIGVL